MHSKWVEEIRPTSVHRKIIIEIEIHIPMHSFCWHVLELELNYANNFFHSPSDCIKCISTPIFQSFLIDNKLYAEDLGTLGTHLLVSFARWLCHWFSTRLLLCWLRINIRTFEWIFQMSVAVKLILGDPFFVNKFEQFIYIDPVGMFGGHLNIWFISLSLRFTGKVLVIPFLNFSRQICPRQVSPALISIFN